MSLPSHLEDRAPTVFGNYLLDEMIAEGGMARVYRARLRGALGFEKPLVVKQVRPELASDPAFIAMFAEEAKTLVRLGHPHIVPVYELGVASGTYFIAMEFVDGVTFERLCDEGPLPAEMVAHLGVQIAEALAHAHERFGLVHRDVTPRNVLVDRQGHARLVDFGIAVTAGTGAAGFGSRGFMSPEQHAGRDVGAPSDLFSLGCLLHWALEGETPFRQKDTFERRGALTAGPLGAIVESLLVDAPEQRPSAGALARTLRSWLSSAAPEGVTEETAARVQRCDYKPPPSSPPAGSTDAKILAAHPAMTAPLSGRIRSSGPAREHSVPSEPTGASEAETDGTVPIAGRSAAEPIEHEESSETRALSTEAAKPTRRGLWLAVALVCAAALAVPFLQTPTQPAAPSTVPAPSAPPEPAPRTNTSEAVAPPEETPPPPEPPPETAPVMRTRRSATLTVGAVPWGSVRIDGDAIGTTPIRTHTLRPGRHRITVANAPLGREVSRVVQIGSGERIRLQADLSTDEPTLRVRR